MKNKQGVVSAIKVTFRKYKHSNPTVPVDIFLYREKPVCPVSIVLAYLGLRGTSPGPLFCWPDASPISRTYFTKHHGQQLGACQMRRLELSADGNPMNFCVTLGLLL